MGTTGMSEGEILADQKVPPDSGGAARRITNHITPPETARPCLTLYSPAYSSSENMHYPVLARIQLI